MMLKFAPLALVLAGCGSSETNSSGPSDGSTASGPTESQGPGNETWSASWAAPGTPWSRPSSPTPT